MNKPTSEDVLGPIVRRFQREKQSRQPEPDEAAGRLRAIDRLASGLTGGPVVEEFPARLLDVIREHQEIEDQWEAVRQLTVRENDPRRKGLLENELEDLRRESAQKWEHIEGLLEDTETARRFALLVALLGEDDTLLFPSD